MSWKTGIARRPLLASVAAVLGIAVVGGAVYEGEHLFGRRYPRTKFDDLLDQLGDRDSAVKLGRAAAEGKEPSFDPRAVAHALRTGPGKGSLIRAVETDIAQGRLTAVQGWVLPTSLIAVAEIAASVQQPS